MKLEAVFFGAQRTNTDAAAEVAREVVAACFAAYPDRPARLNTEGVYLFLSPVHESGLRIAWPMHSNGQLAGDVVDQLDLARGVSILAGAAVFFSYTDTVGGGEMTEFVGGREGRSWESDDDGSSGPLTRGLRKHFGLSFREVQWWFESWIDAHPFVPGWGQGASTHTDTSEAQLFALAIGKPLQLLTVARAVTPAEWQQHHM